MANEPILIVDDNPTNLKLVRVLLANDGYEVHTASTGAEALALLETIHPRLILMDLQLPGMDGLAVTRQLKADSRWRAIPVVALTSYAMKGDDLRAREAGCQGYVTKPIDTRSFSALIAGYLAS